MATYNLPATPTILILSLLTLISVHLYIKFTTKSSKPPLPRGPRGLPIVGSLPFINPKLHHYFTELSQTYGPILSLGLGSKLCIVLSSPETIQEALKDNDLIFANHSPPASVRALNFKLTDMLWAPYGPLWRALRKLSVQELLSPCRIEALEPLRRREVRKAIAKLKSLEGKPVDVGELMFLTSLNIMTSMLWGVSVDDNDGKELHEVLVAIIETAVIPNVSDFFPVMEMFDMQGIQRRMRRLGERYERVVKRIEDERRSKIIEDENSMKPFVQVLMEAVERSESENSEQQIGIKHVNGLLLNLVGGATDTSSTTIEWAMAELMLNPEAMRKAKEELDETVGKDKIIEESDLHKLRYLNAVVKETLRLHPVLPLLAPHNPSSTCTVGGYKIPKGSDVYFNIWAVHRDASLWGEPEGFKPERFLAGDRKCDFNGKSFSYLPFGSGRRICVGISLAEKMVMLMLASLLHSFEWRLLSGTKVELTEKFGIVLKKSEPLRIVPIARLGMAELYT